MGELPQQSYPNAFYQEHAPQYPPLAIFDPFDLDQLSIALNYGQLAPRFPPAAEPSGLVYPTQNTPQYAAPQAINLANPPYAYQTPFQGGYVIGNHRWRVWGISFIIKAMLGGQRNKGLHL